MDFNPSTFFHIFIGAHTGKTFLDIFKKLLDHYEFSSQLHTITTNNASTNGNMAKLIRKKIKNFNHKTHLLGCITHVINFSEKSALSTFGKYDNNSEESEDPPPSMMDFQYITNEPSGMHMNLKTVLTCIHGSSFFVQETPQLLKRFSQTVHFIQPDKFQDFLPNNGCKNMLEFNI